MGRAIHQLVIGASEGDAITSMALKIREALRRHVDSEIYARWVFSESLKDDVLLLDELPPSRSTALLVYHSSYGLPMVTNILVNRAEPLALVFHNFTPWQTYLRWNPDFALGLEWGHKELRMIRNQVVKTISDSAYSIAELIEAGYDDIDVLPMGVDLERLTAEPIDSARSRNLSESYPDGYVLAVSQILHHKRIEQVIETVHFCNLIHGTNLGLLIVGVSRQPAYLQAVQKHSESLPRVKAQLLGSVSQRELATLYRGARAFVTMSDHEGLGIPPLEAMAFGVPVVAKGAGALPETIGDAGLVLPANASPALAAEALFEVISNEETRAWLVSAGLARVAQMQDLSSHERAAEVLLRASR